MSDTDDNNKIEDQIEKLPIDDDDEVFGKVTEMLGDNRIRAVCSDGEERICRIPGSMVKRVWIRQDDLIVLEPWSWQDEKADIVHRFENKEAEIIQDSDYINID